MAIRERVKNIIGSNGKVGRTTNCINCNTRTLWAGGVIIVIIFRITVA